MPDKPDPAIPHGAYSERQRLAVRLAVLSDYLAIRRDPSVPPDDPEELVEGLLTHYGLTGRADAAEAAMRAGPPPPRLGLRLRTATTDPGESGDLRRWLAGVQPAPDSPKAGPSS